MKLLLILVGIVVAIVSGAPAGSDEAKMLGLIKKPLLLMAIKPHLLNGTLFNHQGIIVIQPLWKNESLPTFVIQHQGTAGFQTQAPVGFDATKSTKGASKLRRDLINAEIANLRDLLPLPQSTRQRLSQLQLMALVCVYVRKANYFQQVFKRHDIAMHQAPTPNIGFSKALSGFLMMLTQNGKLLYISDNAAEYLGHSMEDLLIHGDSVYDIIDKQDHGPIQAELGRNIPQQTGTHHHPHSNISATNLDGEQRIFLCRMNVSRNARRQMRFGDQKVVLVQGHYLSFLPLCSRNEPVFLATCTPIAMPETRECVVQGATNVFTTVHSMDMKIIHIDKNGEFHLGYSRTEIQGLSWYQLVHWDYTREAQTKHRLITQSEQDRSCILLVRVQRRQGDFIWVHAVLQVRDGQDSHQQPVIVCTNQVLSDREASVMVTNSWLYHYYSMQSKIQFGLPFDGQTRYPTTPPYYTHPPPNHHHTPTPQPGYPTTPTLQPHMSYTTPHHVPYGYHSPVGVVPSHQSSPSSVIGHHNGNTHNDYTNFGISSEYQRINFNRLDSQPVDYSQSQSEPRCSSTNSTNSSTHSTNSNIKIKLPPNKRRLVNHSNGHYIIESHQEVTESTIIELSSSSTLSQPNEISGHGPTVLLTTVIPPHRPRLFTTKTLLPTEPPDFIDQWNPSPPWSETAQKVPDITHHELSPYLMTTTPPTPTSAPPQTNPAHNTNGHHHHHHTFSFDWMPEQFVPIMDCNGTCVPCITQDGVTLPMHVPVSLQLPHWPPHDHRILPLQPIDRRIDDEDEDSNKERNLR